MDREGKLLHYLNVNSIPTYALYGETDGEARQDWLHWETIQARSRLHDYRIAPHRHEQFFQLLHLTDGLAEMTLDGDVHELLPGNVVLVPAGAVHGYVFSTDVRGVVVTLMERDIVGLGLPRPDAGVMPRDSEEVAAALGRLIAEADRPGPGHDVAMRAHLTLLMIALRRAGPDAAPAGDSGRGAQLMTRFRDLVEQRYRQSRRVTEYADAVGISHTHLNRLCRERLGCSALAVIEQRLANEARRHLLFSTLSIKQIGAELGYDDPGYFSRFISRMFGLPPARLRERMRRR